MEYRLYRVDEAMEVGVLGWVTGACQVNSETTSGKGPRLTPGPQTITSHQCGEPGYLVPVSNPWLHRGTLAIHSDTGTPGEQLA